MSDSALPQQAAIELIEKLHARALVEAESYGDPEDIAAVGAREIAGLARLAMALLRRSPGVAPESSGVSIPRETALRTWNILSQCVPCAHPECQVADKPTEEVEWCYGAMKDVLASPAVPVEAMSEQQILNEADAWPDADACPGIEVSRTKLARLSFAAGMRRARALLVPAVVPAGYALVPVEPTKAMLEAAVKNRYGAATYKNVSDLGTSSCECEAADDYRAMLKEARLEAAPAPQEQPAQPIGEVMDRPAGEMGNLTWPRVVWRDGGCTAMPPIGTKLYAAPAALPAVQPLTEARSDKDYAIEHAEYMATDADRLLEAINALSAAELRREEHDDDDGTVADARDDVWSATRSLRSGIYEFRKRRDRAIAPPAKEQPAPHVDPIDTYQQSVEMDEEIRRNALTDGVATPPCIYRTGCQEADKCAKAEHCTAPIGDDFSGCRPPMRHIAGVNEETLRSAGGVALGGKEQQIEHALSRCDGCVKPDVCAAGKCFRGFPVRADSVLGTYKGKPE